MSRTEKQAFLSTIGCLVFMIVGFILEKLQIDIYPLFFVVAIIFGGWKQTYEGLSEIVHEKTLNVDLLMALAAIGACLIGNWFEGAMLTFIFCLSGALEEYTTNKSKKEITSLMQLKPTRAFKIVSGSTIEVDVAELAINDHVMVPKGAAIPIDGQIIQGRTTIDEAAISGESVPVEKSVGADVFGGTTNTGNAFTMTVTKRSDDTLFAKIIKLVDEAQNTPTQAASLIEKIENIYVKVVLILVPLSILLSHFLIGWTWQESFYRGMVLLVVASPCALVAAATPATLAAISNGARNGVLFKGGSYLENLSQLKAIAFDKTGTLTRGKPSVTDTLFLGDREEAIQVLVALESKTTHPLAEAIVDHFLIELPKELQKIDVEEVTGFGIQANIDGHLWKIGKHAFNPNDPTISAAVLDKIDYYQNAGKTVIYLAKDNHLQAVLALFDVAKEESKQAIAYFNQAGIHTTMITGDHPGTARVIAKELGIEQYYANCLPEDKTKLIAKQKEQYGVNAMVGDGINDAPALATASIGVAMGQGTDIAMDVADIVLIKNDLSKLQMSHLLSKKLQRIIKQNIVFSVAVIILLIFSNFFQVINLPLGVVGHEGSTILVILNGLRMLRSIKLTPHNTDNGSKSCGDCEIYQYIHSN